MSVVELTAKNFDQTIANNNIVFIDFWAEWCEPCVNFAKIYQKVAEQYGDIVFAKVNVEHEPDLAADFNVRSIPQLMVFKQSIAIFAESGSLPESALEDLVAQSIAVDVEPLKQKIAQLDNDK